MTYKQATKAVRGGLNSDLQFGCVVPPIYLSSTYNFVDYNQPRSHDYSRRGNPSRDLANATLAELEGGCSAVLTSSGMSAIHLICTALLKSGDVLLAPKDCYGGSHRLFNSMKNKGFYQVEFVDYASDNIEQVILSLKPRLVLIETPSNPLLRITDITRITQAAHQAGALVAVDNTFLSPIFQQPLALGADLVIHSCTKYLNGHSDIIAGVVIGKDNELMTELAWWANNLGITGAAFDSYLLLRGLKTLSVRMKQQQQNALAIAEFLQKQEKVKKLYYPGLITHAGYEIACRQQQGFGAMLSFELDGDEHTLRAFLNSLSLFTLAESLGGTESLISHAATMTHASMSAEARQQAGISDSLLRLSIGLEEHEDLIADLANAFAKIASSD